MTTERIDVEGGKYTVVVEENGGLSALRNGEPWQDLTGNKLVYCLAAELQAERAKTERLRVIIDEVHSWVVCGCIATPQDMAQNFEHITKITAPEDNSETDSERLTWLLPVITGEQSLVADTRTAALGACLMVGLDGRKAVDRAMGMTK